MCMMPPGAVQSAAYEQHSGRQPWGIRTLAEKMNVDAIGGQMVFSNTDSVVLPAETGGRGLGGTKQQTDRQEHSAQEHQPGQEAGDLSALGQSTERGGRRAGGLSEGDNPNAAA